MFLLAFHIVAIGMVIMVTWSIAYKKGMEKAERAHQKRLQIEAEDQKLQDAS